MADFTKSDAINTIRIKLSLIQGQLDQQYGSLQAKSFMTGLPWSPFSQNSDSAPISATAIISAIAMIYAYQLEDETTPNVFNSLLQELQDQPDFKNEVRQASEVITNAAFISPKVQKQISQLIKTVLPQEKKAAALPRMGNLLKLKSSRPEISVVPELPKPGTSVATALDVIFNQIPGSNLTIAQFYFNHAKLQLQIIDYLKNLARDPFFTNSIHFQKYLFTIENSSLALDQKKRMLSELKQTWALNPALKTIDSTGKQILLSWLFEPQVPRMTDGERASYLNLVLDKNVLTPQDLHSYAGQLPKAWSKDFEAELKVDLGQIIKELRDYIVLFQKKNAKLPMNYDDISKVQTNGSQFQEFLQRLSSYDAVFPLAKNKNVLKEIVDFQALRQELIKHSSIAAAKETAAVKPSLSDAEILQQLKNDLKQNEQKETQHLQAIISRLDGMREHFAENQAFLAVARDNTLGKNGLNIFSYLQTPDSKFLHGVSQDDVDDFMGEFHQAQMDQRDSYRRVNDKINAPDFVQFGEQQVSILIAELGTLKNSSLPIGTGPTIPQLTSQILDHVAASAASPQEKTNLIAQLFEHDLIEPSHMVKLGALINANELDKKVALAHMQQFKANPNHHLNKESHLFADFLKNLGIDSFAHYNPTPVHHNPTPVHRSNPVNNNRFAQVVDEQVHIPPPRVH